jgi:proton-coupled amino acid transporter
MGPALLTLIAVLVWFNMHSLVETRARLSKHNPDKLIRTYGDLGFYSLGRVGALLVEVLLVSMELGICTVYFECISTNLFAIYPRAPHEMEEDYSHDEKDAEVEVVQFKQLMVCCSFPVMMVLSWIRNMRSLAPLSAIANVLMGFGLVVIVAYATLHMSAHGVVKGLPLIKEPVMTNLPVYFGTVIYSFEGAGAVLPILNSMQVLSIYKFVERDELLKKPESLGRRPRSSPL